MPSTKAIFEKFAVTDTGDVIPGAEYTVVSETTGTPLTIYSSREGASKSAPYFADANGLIQFYVDAGAMFRVAVTGPTGTITSRYNQGLLLTESPTDTTAGRVTKVGDGGLLSKSPEITNLDTLFTSGLYDIDVNAVGQPINGNSGVCLVGLGGAGGAFQLWMRSNLYQDENIYLRHYNGSDWNDWQELYHTGNVVGTVQADGSGAIIESGSNDNGSYVKYADGSWRGWSNDVTFSYLDR